MSLWFVITSIQPPTIGVQAIAQQASASAHRVVVVGDRKSPTDWECLGVDYLPIQEQEGLSFATAGAVPFDSYTRKMLGYLVAAAGGADWIRETDDDNQPYGSFFEPVPSEVEVRQLSDAPEWVNIYEYFTERFVWPRGFPLGLLHPQQMAACDPAPSGRIRAPFVLQAVADGDPDVDAVYRLTAPDTSDVIFDQAPPLLVPDTSWTPFNSQATTWPRELFPLMYLPSTCSFRMTDIWRSFVAQRVMKSLGVPLIITASTVFQDRNDHDLMKDFRDEIEGYLGYQGLVSQLKDLVLEGTHESLLRDLRVCYEALVEADYLKPPELSVLSAWTSDMSELGFGGRP